MVQCYNKYKSFRAFGEQLTSVGSFKNMHRFTGKEYENSGVYYFGARYYDPWLGRFLTPDPLGKFDSQDPRTLNPYIYCSDNPLRYVDPDGRWRTYTENGVSYAYREPPIDPLIRSVASYFSGFEMADCIIRSAQGDVTLSKSDWIWAAVDIAIPVASEVSKSAGLKQALKDIQKATYGVGFYEGASEYEKAKDLDPVIFERYTATTGIKEQPFGVVSGKYRILIRNAEDLKTLKCISKEVANEKKNENKPPELHLEPRDYWHYNVQ